MKHIDPKALQGRPLEPEGDDLEEHTIKVIGLDKGAIEIPVIRREPGHGSPNLPPLEEGGGGGMPEKPWRMQKEHLCLLFCATAACFSSEKTLVRMGGLCFFAASIIGVSSLYQ